MSLSSLAAPLWSALLSITLLFAGAPVLAAPASPAEGAAEPAERTGEERGGDEAVAQRAERAAEAMPSTRPENTAEGEEVAAETEAAPGENAEVAEPAVSAPVPAPAPEDDQSGIDPQTRLLLQRPIVTRLTLSHRGLLVVDEDPANNQLSLYQLSASGAIFKQLRLFGGALWRQHYSVEPDESALQLGDLQLGLSYPMTLPVGNDLRLVIFHVAAFTLPTSRQSRAQDLYFSPRYLASVSLMPIPNLVLSTTPSFRYRFHEYAERAGYGGGMNTQLDMSLNIGADYLIDQTPLFSRYRIGASAGTSYWRRYDSREEYESAASDQDFWNQLYSWEAHLVYTPSFFFSVSLSVEHNSSVRRNGIVNTFFMHRDETEVALSFSGRY